MRRSVLASLVALVCASGVTLAGIAPAGAAKAPNPCSVFKTSEISSVFGVTVTNGEKGLTTAASTQCDYDVPAGTGRPSGTLTVTIMFAGAKAAYTGLPQYGNYSTINESGVKGLYSPPPLSVLSVLKGSKLLSVQGVFLDLAARTTFVDVKTELLALAKIGQKRV